MLVGIKKIKMNETEKNEILSLSKDLGEVGLDSLLENSTSGRF